MQEHIMFMLIGICLILMIFSFITNSMDKRRRFSLFFMAMSSILLLVSNKLTYFYNGDTSTVGLCLAKSCKFMAYLMFLVIITIFNQYIKDLFTKEGEMDTLPKGLRYAEYILLVGVIILVISQFTKFYYYYDANNVYHRTKWYVLSYVFPILALLFQLVTIIKHRKKLSKTLFIPLVIFIIIPMMAGVVQFFVHGVSLTSTFIVGMVVLIYCFSVFDTNKFIETAHKKEIEMLLEKQRDNDLMVEQTTFALVEAIDAKDNYTNGHSKRVADYSAEIAKKCGKSEKECKKIHLIALLHDVGKIGIPDTIINKAGRLTDEEYAIIKTHPKIGRDILSKISISPELSIGASFHHERYDGKGYPFGLKGEEIPEIARIIAVADTYDAMASKRSYRDILPKEKIQSELEKGMGTQFDPKFAKIMLEIIE